MFKAPPGCGLPIGNLTSQFFANVYLDPLDQFVKHPLKARYYLRYCADLVLLSAEQTQLEDWERQIDAFLAERLHPQPNGTLAKQTDRIFADLRGDEPGVPDGMKVDVEGSSWGLLDL